MDKPDVVVIGGGPAGMMAAGRAAELGVRVVLLEKNGILGKKLRITGGGRCNVFHAEFDTHILTEKYGKKGKCLHSVFAQFGVEDTKNFFESRGVPIKVEAEKRAFPVSNSALDIERVMEHYLAENSVKILRNCEVHTLQKFENTITKVVHSLGEIEAKKIIIATGGKSHPETGSTGDGFVWLEHLGHTVATPSAALVPLSVHDSWISNLAGISIADTKVTMYCDEKKEGEKKGKLLFTHTGLSGPLILNMSKRIGELLQSGKTTLSIDFFPTEDLGTLDAMILKRLEEEKNKMIKNWIGRLLPSRLGEVILHLSSINPETPLHQLTRDERKKIVHMFKAMPLHVKSLLGPKDAVVTGGGVALNEVNFTTMQSKFYDNLYLVGDVLDFDRPSGGFSLQICWSTGFVAGSAAANR